MMHTNALCSSVEACLCASPTLHHCVTPFVYFLLAGIGGHKHMQKHVAGKLRGQVSTFRKLLGMVINTTYNNMIMKPYTYILKQYKKHLQYYLPTVVLYTCTCGPCHTEKYDINECAKYGNIITLYNNTGKMCSDTYPL